MRDWWLPKLSVRSALLLPLAALFGWASAARRVLYRSGVLSTQRLPVPILVVGNLIVGGSGKTPLVIALAHALRARGWRPGVISRGYGRSTGRSPASSRAGGGAAHGANGANSAHDDAVSSAARSAASLEVTADTDAASSGDEPLLIARAARVPVFVDANRPRAGRALLAAHPDVNVIISDDGLQHYALARDIEIAVFDARGAGNGCLLPAGPLREPLSRAASLTALVTNDSGGNASKSGLHQRFSAMYHMTLVPQPCYRLLDPAETITLTALAKRAQRGRIAAVVGIGNPARFFATLRAAGLDAGDTGFTEHVFPDHHAYTRADLAAIDADILIVTEKDALKCAAFNDDRIWVLPVAAQVDSALIELIELILEKLRGHQAA